MTPANEKEQYHICVKKAQWEVERMSVLISHSLFGEGTGSGCKFTSVLPEDFFSILLKTLESRLPHIVQSWFGTQTQTVAINPHFESRLWFCLLNAVFFFC